MTTEEKTKTTRVHAPDPQHYLAASVSLSGNKLVIDPCNRWDPPPGQQPPGGFAVRLNALKVENATEHDVTITISTHTSYNANTDTTGPAIVTVIATVPCGGSTSPDAPVAPYAYNNGAWIFVDREARYVTVSADAEGVNASDSDTFPIKIRADTVLVTAGEEQWARSHDRSKDSYFVHIQDGNVRIDNESATVYYMWIPDAQATGGWSVLRQGNQPRQFPANTSGIEVLVDGFGTFKLSSSSQTAPSTKPFRIFDSNGSTAYFFIDTAEDDNGQWVDSIRSAPYAVTPNAGSVMVAYSDPHQPAKGPAQLSIYAEGNAGGAQAVGRNGQAVPFSVPHPRPAGSSEHYYQASLHWTPGDDPKIIVRQDDLATNPTGGARE